MKLFDCNTNEQNQFLTLKGVKIPCSLLSFFSINISGEKETIINNNNIYVVVFPSNSASLQLDINYCKKNGEFFSVPETAAFNISKDNGSFNYSNCTFSITGDELSSVDCIICSSEHDRTAIITGNVQSYTINYDSNSGVIRFRYYNGKQINRICSANLLALENGQLEYIVNSKPGLASEIGAELSFKAEELSISDILDIIMAAINDTKFTQLFDFARKFSKSNRLELIRLGEQN